MDTEEVMRICFTTSDDLSQIGGAEWSIRRIADYMANNGTQIDIVCFDLDSVGHTWGTKIPGVTQLPSWRPELRLFQIRQPNEIPDISKSYRSVAIALERLHELYNYDLFHAFFLSSMGFITTLTGRKVRRPVIVSARGSDINRDTYSTMRLASIMWTIQHATRLTFVSNALLELANTLIPCLDRSHVILNATSSEFFTGSINSMMTKPEGFVIGGAGLLSYKKNWIELLEIVARLRKQQLPVKLLWIGEIALSELNTISQSIRSLSLQDHITITGKLPHESMIEAMKLLDVFVSTSLDEGCPNACLEAMLAARPIVAFDVGAFPQLIHSGKEGILLRLTTTSEFVDVISSLYFDNALATKLGYAAKERVLQDFTTAKERDQWESCYQLALLAYE